MKWINYNHLFYFWIVAREGGVMRASEELMLSQPTISAQLKELEISLGHRLFERAGRGRVLTEAGQIAFNYANEIFSMGQDLVNALEHQPVHRPIKLTVGVLDLLPKPVVQRMLAPALKLGQPVRLICKEDKADRLLSDLAARRIDIVISDRPIGIAAYGRGFNHLLGECGVSFFASKELATKYRRGFPKSLTGAPLLLPADHTQVRSSLNDWFNAKKIHPMVVGEFDDSALMFAFGRRGVGIFAAPSVVVSDIQTNFGVHLVGATEGVRERFYAITREEHPEQPAVAAILAAAQTNGSR